MSRRRDIVAFDRRAPAYEDGWLGQLHHQIADRTADLALDSVAAPAHILDVGCGTGYLLRQLAARAAGAVELTGIDAAPAMVEAANAAADDPRLHVTTGVAERLPFPDATFDLVVSTTSFDHWQDQPAGLAECARVTAPGGRLVLVDQFSVLLLPTLLGSRRDKARTRRRASRLLGAAGYRSWQWHHCYALIIRAVTATR
ncbi:MAG TPA: class I SAM-dependent methyltransferase [Acidimicrobiales bacterium]|nr:class I SAM-dependent methyltransferase [Acidimicrobiales bacterium]